MFIENFWIKLDLKSVDSQNFLQVRNCIPQNKLQPKDEFNALDSAKYYHTILR